MYRFFGGIRQLVGIRTTDELAKALPDMTNYLECNDRDGGHILAAIDASCRAGVDGLDPRVVSLRLGAVLRELRRGRVREFSRSPTPGDATDPGLTGDVAKVAFEMLLALADEAASLGMPLAVLRYSAESIARDGTAPKKGAIP